MGLVIAFVSHVERAWVMAGPVTSMVVVVSSAFLASGGSIWRARAGSGPRWWRSWRRVLSGMTVNPIVIARR